MVLARASWGRGSKFHSGNECFFALFTFRHRQIVTVCWGIESGDVNKYFSLSSCFFLILLRRLYFPSISLYILLMLFFCYLLFLFYFSLFFIFFSLHLWFLFLPVMYVAGNITSNINVQEIHSYVQYRAQAHGCYDATGKKVLTSTTVHSESERCLVKGWSPI